MKNIGRKINKIFKKYNMNLDNLDNSSKISVEDRAKLLSLDNTINAFYPTPDVIKYAIEHFDYNVENVIYDEHINEYISLYINVNKKIPNLVVNDVFFDINKLTLDNEDYYSGLFYKYPLLYGEYDKKTYELSYEQISRNKYLLRQVPNEHLTDDLVYKSIEANPIGIKWLCDRKFIIGLDLVKFIKSKRIKHKSEWLYFNESSVAKEYLYENTFGNIGNIVRFLNLSDLCDIISTNTYSYNEINEKYRCEEVSIALVKSDPSRIKYVKKQTQKIVDASGIKPGDDLYKYVDVVSLNLDFIKKI